MRASATPRRCAQGSRCLPIRSSASPWRRWRLPWAWPTSSPARWQLQRENDALREKQLQAAKDLVTLEALAAENAQLRRLVEARERLPRKSTLAEILYAGRDPFSRKVIIDKGSQDGIQTGLPVVDDVGVIGQVTRVLPAAFRGHADHRQGPCDTGAGGSQRAARGGLWRAGTAATLDLRFMAANADILNGDVLVTSGIDGTYPPGIAGGQGRAHRTRRRLCVRQDRLRADRRHRPAQSGAGARHEDANLPARAGGASRPQPRTGPRGKRARRRE